LLVRLATTRAIDRLRQNGRRRRTDACNEEPIAYNADPIDALETQDLADRLREAIAGLPPQEAQVFCLRHLGELSYRQIARELQIGVGAVGVSLHRAKARLRESLGAAIASDEVSHEQTR
jgi:RNA polymerase sigma-70 factor (ECF subfamily)